MVKFISVAFIICITITLILANVVRPNSSVFAPSFVLQLFAYLIMMICAIVVSKTQINNTFSIYLISFITSYFIIQFILSYINSGNLFEIVISINKGKDFMIMLFPFILSNILMGLYILFYKK